MSGLIKAIGTASVLAALAGGIWAGVRPKVTVETAREVTPTEPQDTTGAQARRNQAEVTQPAAAAAPPPTKPQRSAAGPSLQRPVTPAAELPSAVVPLSAPTGPVPAPNAAASPPAPPHPLARPTFADHRDLVDRPATTFLDPRPVALPEAARQGTPPPPAAASRFEDRRQLIADKASSPVVTAHLASPVDCGPAEVVTEPMEGGRMRLRIVSACRAGRSLSLEYGGAVLARRFDGVGRLEMNLDLFAGTVPATLTLHDGSRQRIPTRARDLERVDKIAIVWSAQVDLDLHAFEYDARPGERGHISPARASTAIAARELTLASGRGRGFLSHVDNGDSPGDKFEVYTHFRAEGASLGPVRVLVDNLTRGTHPMGRNCGDGADARVIFESITLSQGQLERLSGEISPQPCAQALDAARRMTPIPQQTVNR